MAIWKKRAAKAADILTDEEGRVAVSDQDASRVILGYGEPSELATLSTDAATSAASQDLTCPVGTLFIEGYSEVAFYYKRGGSATTAEQIQLAGNFRIPFAVSGESATFGMLVSTSTAASLRAKAMGRTE